MRALKYPHVILEAVVRAHNFVADELEIRKSSYLPDPEPDEAAEIADAEETLALLQSALDECGAAA